MLVAIPARPFTPHNGGNHASRRQRDIGRDRKISGIILIFIHFIFVHFPLGWNLPAITGNRATRHWRKGWLAFLPEVFYCMSFISCMTVDIVQDSKMNKIRKDHLNGNTKSFRKHSHPVCVNQILNASADLFSSLRARPTVGRFQRPSSPFRTTTHQPFLKVK
jgi:hypothetical protein